MGAHPSRLRPGRGALSARLPRRRVRLLPAEHRHACRAHLRPLHQELPGSRQSVGGRHLPGPAVLAAPRRCVQERAPAPAGDARGLLHAARRRRLHGLASRPAPRLARSRPVHGIGPLPRGHLRGAARPLRRGGLLAGGGLPGGGREAALRRGHRHLRDLAGRHPAVPARRERDARAAQPLRPRHAAPLSRAAGNRALYERTAPGRGPGASGGRAGCRCGPGDRPARAHRRSRVHAVVGNPPYGARKPAYKVPRSTPACTDAVPRSWPLAASARATPTPTRCSSRTGSSGCARVGGSA